MRICRFWPFFALWQWPVNPLRYAIFHTGCRRSRHEAASARNTTPAIAYRGERGRIAGPRQSRPIAPGFENVGTPDLSIVPRIS